jgi:hypothetical protein
MPAIKAALCLAWVALTLSGAGCATPPPAPESELAQQSSQAGANPEASMVAGSTTQMADGNVRECRRTAYTGSRMRKDRICMTRAEWADYDAKDKDQDLDAFWRRTHEAATMSNTSQTFSTAGPSP